jgi:hypothetical protein
MIMMLSLDFVFVRSYETYIHDGIDAIRDRKAHTQPREAYKRTSAQA